jgi:hypothetical protein
VPQGRDPAERSNLRFLYRDWRPTWYGRCWTRFYAWLAGLGLWRELLLTLVVEDRQTGKLESHVLVPVRYEGSLFLVSMLGDGSNWVQDARVARGAAFVRRIRLRRVTLAEIPPAGRAPILRAWCQIATSGRKHLPVPYDAPVAAFGAIASDYPVFRIDPG